MAGSPQNLLNSAALSEIASVDGKIFASAIKEIIALDQEPTVRSTMLFERVNRVFRDSDYAAAVCSQSVAMATIRRLNGDDISTIYDNVVESMVMNDLDSTTQSWFQENRDSFLKMLESKSVRLVAKALNLSVDFSEVLVSANIVTDIRPVFDIGRASVVGGIVAHTFRVHYISGDGRTGEQELSLAIDSDDIEKLIKELEKAQRKSKAAKEFVSTSLKGNAFISGEDRYGFS